VWVGLGFQAKMLQAWMVLPALGLGYLLAAPNGLGRRLWQLGVAGLVMLAVSLSWIALYTFTPAADRPYVDRSTNNSAGAMGFGSRGGGRFGVSLPGAAGAFGGGGGAPRGRPRAAGRRGSGRGRRVRRSSHRGWRGAHRDRAGRRRVQRGRVPGQLGEL